MVILVSMGCKQLVNKEENTTNPTTEIVHSEEASDYVIDWVDAINDTHNSSIEKMYASDAIKIVSEDSIIESSSEIATYYKTKKDKITSVESLFHVEASKNRGIHYELIRYTTEDLQEYVQVVIWRLNNEQVLREFEFTERSSPEAKKVDTNEIADRRKLWMELCNAHNAENLVKELYSSNTMYFNHKPIVKGVENLIKEYDYMNNSDYTLHLEPMKLEVVNENFAYEIGQCSGSYNGKYLLVWKKQSDGHWKIHIDSNI
jgi:ketosteroid isomerase-like protein